MSFFSQAAPNEPGDLLIRLHNLVGAAVDVTGRQHSTSSRWVCHGCGSASKGAERDYLTFTRNEANGHANECRAAYHHLG
ncbi:hypothetical protein AB0L26_27970 [Streptomyces nondiastaticus]|uniref:hypothetical protein n=1 Tax=Streptomyces nondiastaticus TaxID=3154512 RepID=UPI00344A554A